MEPHAIPDISLDQGFEMSLVFIGMFAIAACIYKWRTKKKIDE